MSKTLPQQGRVFFLSFVSDNSRQSIRKSDAGRVLLRMPDKVYPNIKSWYYKLNKGKQRKQKTTSKSKLLKQKRQYKYRREEAHSYD